MTIKILELPFAEEEEAIHRMLFSFGARPTETVPGTRDADPGCVSLGMCNARETRNVRGTSIVTLLHIRASQRCSHRHAPKTWTVHGRNIAIVAPTRAKNQQLGRSSSRAPETITVRRMSIAIAVPTSASRTEVVAGADITQAVPQVSIATELTTLAN
jgi:hypothetical protein